MRQTDLNASQVKGERTVISFNFNFVILFIRYLSISVFTGINKFLLVILIGLANSRPIKRSWIVNSVLYVLNKSSSDKPSFVKQSSSRTIISYATSTKRRVK